MLLMADFYDFQVKEEENAKLKKTLTEREKTAADLQKK